MKIFNAQQIREIDNYTIQHEPINSIDLMERAAQTLGDHFLVSYSTDQPVYAFVGAGNNGGDALALANILSILGYKTTLFLTSQKMSDDATTNLKRVRNANRCKITILEREADFPKFDEKPIIIDALFGSGLSRIIDGFYAKLITHINASGCKILAIDFPSGLFCENNATNNPQNIIKATQTITFQFPKLSFMFAENEPFIGNWMVKNIGLHPDMIDKTATKYHYVDLDYAKTIYRKRSKFSHKGTFGHALLIAGSYGKMGAAVLSAKGCMRAGVGLLTVQIPKCGIYIMQISIPEAMVNVDVSNEFISEIKVSDSYNAIGFGPGIGTHPETKTALENLIKSSSKPLVIDADGINILAQNPELLNQLPPNTILTPHPKEFERLTQKCDSGYQRHLEQLKFSQKYGVIVVLKGAHTSISSPEGNCYFNSTGNAGMATAGSGDMLTGIILSLLAQSYEPLHAAILGVFLHGQAGDLYVAPNAEESLIASDIANYIGKAFAHLAENNAK